MQKSQVQSRTSASGSNRRKTRVMSDDEDMIMDETNQVRVYLILKELITINVCI